MSWKVRHAGSPQDVEGLTLEQVTQGLQDGVWEPTDEVMGPDDRAWVPFESHPQFLEICLDLEPPPPRTYDDETRLDMNALIDVCLVLLIFFILTTSYAALQKMLDMPDLRADPDQKLARVTQDKIQELMILVDVQMEPSADGGEQPVIRVEGEAVTDENLLLVLTRFANASKKSYVLLKYGDRVPYGKVVQVQDAASGAQIKKIYVGVQPGEVQ